MNNIGGIIQCEILSVDDIISFAIVNQNIKLQKKEAATWKLLPISPHKTVVYSTPSAGDAGILYEHKFSTFLPANKVTIQEVSYYRSLCLSGCILRYTDANGNLRIVGTKEYPLIGTIAETSGDKATALAGYDFSLKASILTPQLPFTEI